MTKLNKERLNQMIDNALSYEQESIRFKPKILYKRLKDFIYKPNAYELIFSSLIIGCVFIPRIVTSIQLVDVNKINDYVILSIIEDF